MGNDRNLGTIPLIQESLLLTDIGQGLTGHFYTAGRHVVGILQFKKYGLQLVFYYKLVLQTDVFSIGLSPVHGPVFTQISTEKTTVIQEYSPKVCYRRLLS